MIVEIKGVEFENKGAQLMLAAIMGELKETWPEVEFALVPSGKATYIQRAALPAWQKLSLRKHLVDANALSYFLPMWVRQKLKAWGIVTEVDVDMIVDASGFSYSDQWPSKVRIYHLKNELKRYKRQGRPYIFMPQAFGPFIRDSSRRRIAQSFRYAAMICAREKQSYHNIAELTGEMPNLYQYGDFTNLIDGFVPPHLAFDGPQACIIPNKNMTNPRNANKAWITSYESMLVAAIKYYREKNLTPFFLNHEGVEDGQLISRVNGQLDEPIDVVFESDPLVVKGIIASSNAVLCSRYHGCISALSKGIACIGTSWSHKYELLYDQYAASDFLLPPNVSNMELKKIIDLSLDVDASQVREISKKALLIRAEAQEMWEQFYSVVEKFDKIPEQKKPC